MTDVNCSQCSTSDEESTQDEHAARGNIIVVTSKSMASCRERWTVEENAVLASIIDEGLDFDSTYKQFCKKKPSSSHRTWDAIKTKYLRCKSPKRPAQNWREATAKNRKKEPSSESQADAVKDDPASTDQIPKTQLQTDSNLASLKDCIQVHQMIQSLAMEKLTAAISEHENQLKQKNFILDAKMKALYTIFTHTMHSVQRIENLVKEHTKYTEERADMKKQIESTEECLKNYDERSRRSLGIFQYNGRSTQNFFRNLDPSVVNALRPGRINQSNVRDPPISD